VKDVAGRSMEDRRAAAHGAGISYDPQLDLVYYGSGNPSTWNPKQRPGDKQMVDDHLRAQSGYRHGEMGLSDDAPTMSGTTTASTR